jgi:hypothetical protein
MSQECFTIAAIVIGPIAAVQVQKVIERATEEKRERFSIFKTLMRTRGNIISRDHVDALNTISLVFTKKNERDAEVRRKWEIYLNRLLLPYPVNASEAIQLDFVKANFKCLTELLMALAKALGYKFDEEDINRVYAPIGHSKEAAETAAIRTHLLEIVQGKRIVNTHTAIFPGNPDISQQFNELMFKVLKGETALKIRPASDDDSGSGQSQ